MAFDNNFIDDLKTRINIVDVIGREVQLKRAGSNFKGLCPFHNEKTPSFMVSEQKQIFNCFGCGEKGDAIKFVERYYGLSFMDAVEKLCEENNITMPKKSGGKNIDYNKYYDINREAAVFFYRNLTSGPNDGYRYISRRGIKDETIKNFGLGFAPNRGNALYTYLRSKNVSDEDMLKLGLVQKGKNGFYDKFRNRVMFPIFNTSGKVIGFGGRALGDVMPKYLNSSESDIFLKKNNLYALNLTKRAISDEDQVLMVEGYMDVISLYQAGVKNVVASLGTALTENQAKLISRYTKNIILSYDADNAGVNAAMRGIDIVKGSNCNVRILRINDGKDPDEFIKNNGREEFLKLVKGAIPATEFRLSVMERGYDFNDDLQILDYIRRCVPILKSISPVEQNIYIKKLASRFGLSEYAIESEIRAGGESASTQQTRRPSVNQSRRERTYNNADLKLDLSFVILMIANKEYINIVRDKKIQFRTPIGKKSLAILSELPDSQGMGIETNRFFEQLDPEEELIINNAINNIRIGPDDQEFFNECYSTYRLNYYKEQKAELINDLTIAEKMGNEKEMSEIASKLIEIDNAIRKVRD